MSVGKRGIIRSMLHIYRIYRYVKLVDKKNYKLAEQVAASIQRGGSAKDFKLISEVDAVSTFSEQRVLFKRLGFVRASQISMASLKNKYLEPAEGDKYENRRLRVTHLKGMPLLDGFFLFRPGLWKAWHDEHGWLFTGVIGGLIIAGLGYAIKWVIMKL